MKYFTPFAPLLAGWCLLMLTSSMHTISALNGVLQLLLFLFVVCLPIWRTGRMSYVDIGWPWGLVVIGILTFILSDGHWIRTSIVSLAYIFVGARMGLGALKLWKLGFMKTEFPRYEYQKLRWKKSGKTNIPLAMQMEALVQHFLENTERIKKMGFDDTFIRKWEYYFNYCAGGFKERAIGCAQLLFAAPKFRSKLSNNTFIRLN